MRRDNQTVLLSCDQCPKVHHFVNRSLDQWMSIYTIYIWKPDISQYILATSARCRVKVRVKINYYVARHLILRIAQCVYTLLRGRLFSIRHHLAFTGRHPATMQLPGEDKYPPMSIARYSFIQPSELDQWKVK